jgi:hypothetical protein
MKNIDEEILFWVKCSNDLWTRWFAHRKDGFHEFINVEQALLDALVIENLLEKGCVLNKDKFFASLRVKYHQKVNSLRTVYIQQKAGNIFGQTQTVSMDPERYYSIHSIDSTGNMSDGSPYVEVKIGDATVLEQIENVSFFVDSSF